jgi:hypothetical protein
MTEWQKIETAPMDETRILLMRLVEVSLEMYVCWVTIGSYGRTFKDRSGPAGWLAEGPYVEEWLKDCTLIRSSGGFIDEKQPPTHWAPLPVFPKPNTED